MDAKETIKPIAKGKPSEISPVLFLRARSRSHSLLRWYRPVVILRGQDTQSSQHLSVCMIFYIRGRVLTCDALASLCAEEQKVYLWSKTEILLAR